MRPRTTLLAATALLTLAFASSRLPIARLPIALGDDKDDKKKAEEFQPPKPGPEHELLKQLEGKWEGKMMLRMAADAPAQESKTTEESKLGCGGFWLITDTKGESQEMGSFVGHGMVGYDTAKKKYVGIWGDSMASYLFPYEGSYDAATKTWTYTGMAKDMQGKDLKVVLKTTVKDKDHYTFTMRHADEAGKDMEALKAEYTRKK
ncbi:MAG TPA: DUF1579 domain-containing protein [Planctomycetota bacterium]|nr:DUF1579 domain-containing protein [Planctomycetota bacterium]